MTEEKLNVSSTTRKSKLIMQNIISCNSYSPKSINSTTSNPKNKKNLITFHLSQVSSLRNIVRQSLYKCEMRFNNSCSVIASEVRLAVASVTPSRITLGSMAMVFFHSLKRGFHQFRR